MGGLMQVGGNGVSLHEAPSRVLIPNTTRPDELGVARALFI
jgi:hypothetical protein